MARILDAMLSGSLVDLLSPALLAEYRSVLLRPELVKRHRLSEAQVDSVLGELAANAMWREPLGEAAPAPDPGDDHLWALLDAYSRSILITGDRLLRQAPLAGSSVIAPSAWGQIYPQPP